MRYKCARCRGRGWDAPRRTDAFPDPCVWCKGAGVLSTPRLARVLHVSRFDVHAAEKMQAGPVRGSRVLAAIARYMPGVLEIRGIAQRVANL